MPAQQSLTVDYLVSATLDGTSAAPEVNIDGADRTPFDEESQIYEPEEVADLGLIDPDLAAGGSIGARCISQLVIDLQGVVAPAGARVTVVAQKGAEYIELFEVIDLATKTVGIVLTPFVIPQGALLMLTGVSAGADPILVRISIETPGDLSGFLATLAISEAIEGGGGPGPTPPPPPVAAEGWYAEAIYVDVNTPVAAGDQDGSLLAPWGTLTAAVADAVAKQDALPIGKLPGERAGTRQVFLVAGGIYDEDLALSRGDTFYIFLALGPVTLGNGLGANFASTNVRHVTWTNTQAVEDADSGLASDNRRPQLVMGTLLDMGEASSTHTAVAVAWDISGRLDLMTPGGAGAASTAELHLGRVKIRGGIDGSADFGIRNAYFYNSYFDSAISVVNVGGMNLQVCDSCEFDGPTTVGSYGRLVNCEIDGGFSPGAFAPAIPPGGMFGCDFSGAFISPGPLQLDAATNFFFVANGATLAGGAVKVLMHDLTP